MLATLQRTLFVRPKKRGRGGEHGQLTEKDSNYLGVADNLP